MRFLRRKGQRARGYRIFFATDIHGSDRCIRKFLAAARVYNANALILGGDIVGKAIVPITRLDGGQYEYLFQGERHVVRDDDLEDACLMINFNGLYPWIAEPREIAEVQHGGEARRMALFEELVRGQITGWGELAADRLDESVRCVITPGNDDPYYVDEVLGDAPRVESPELRVVELGPVWLASLGNTNRTPWNSEREFDEDDLTRQIDEMLEGYADGRPLVFNFHAPPAGSGLDTVQKLDGSFRPVVEHGAPVEIPAGSTAVRDAILKYRPTVGLHGHVHESHGFTRIGETVCINPGSDYSAGALRGVIVDFNSEGKVEEYLLTAG